ncbi:hypothetical protein SAMN02787118_11127 [Streptomyces mirabilis]|uniref:Uncharacterized protein n=1 Tax=Streptomyces mirabilis TaxID=68239 RepID=A0A1I2L2E4_9ACTN|nr:hypothetical protein SAMN02787118_11127 [Streptomyces mirabilis]
MTATRSPRDSSRRAPHRRPHSGSSAGAQSGAMGRWPGKDSSTTILSTGAPTLLTCWGASSTPASPRIRPALLVADPPKQRGTPYLYRHAPQLVVSGPDTASDGAVLATRSLHSATNPDDTASEHSTTTEPWAAQACDALIGRLARTPRTGRRTARLRHHRAGRHPDLDVAPHRPRQHPHLATRPPRPRMGTPPAPGRTTHHAPAVPVPPHRQRDLGRPRRPVHPR